MSILKFVSLSKINNEYDNDQHIHFVYSLKNIFYFKHLFKHLHEELYVHNIIIIWLTFRF